jgi:hypothetical protein
MSKSDELRKHLILFAQGEIGTRESAPGKVKYNDFYYPDSHPYHKQPRGWHWCGTFCVYVYHYAAQQVGVPSPLTSQLNFDQTTHYVPAFHNWATRNKKITTEPKQGDLVNFDWQGDKSADHIGIFSRWVDRSKGLFEAIEGNTSPGNDSHGGRVMLRQRNLRHVMSFVNVID